ncbi:MAG: alpha/beta hydrolase [Pseudomonadota bacterium]
MSVSSVPHTLLALHGSASSAKQWSTLKDAVAHSFSVVTPTLLDTSADCRLVMLLDEVAQCPGRIHILAHSFGAAVALKIANQRPDKIASVTLYDAVVPIETADRIAPPLQLQELSMRMRRESPEHGMALFLDFWAGSGSWDASSSRRRDALAAKYTSVLNDFDQLIAGEWTSDPILYDGPMAVLQGGKSPTAIKQVAEYLARSYPNVTSFLLPGLDHMAPLTLPNLTDALFMKFVFSHLPAHQLSEAA